MAGDNAGRGSPLRQAARPCRPRTVRRLGDAAWVGVLALVIVMIGSPDPATPATPAPRADAARLASMAPSDTMPSDILASDILASDILASDTFASDTLAADIFASDTTPRPANTASAISASTATTSALSAARRAIRELPRAPTTTTTTTTTTTPPTTTTTMPPGAVVLPPSGPPPVIYNIPTPDRVVFVTIDDGWTNDPSVLTFIHDHNLPVSAFLIDRVATATAPFWQLLVSMGGVVEDHSVNHPPLRGQSLAAQQAEVCPPVDDYQRLFGRRPTLFRPPYGSMDATTVTAAGACGLRAVVLWNAVIDRGKFTRATAGPLGPGDIVLLHWGPALGGDLQRLSELMAAGGLHAALLEDYLRAP